MSIYKLLVKITVMRQPCLTIIISYFDQIFRLKHFILITILSRVFLQIICYSLCYCIWVLSTNGRQYPSYRFTAHKMIVNR